MLKEPKKELIVEQWNTDSDSYYVLAWWLLSLIKPEEVTE